MGSAIDHDNERREHATYRVCTPFHAFVSSTVERRSPWRVNEFAKCAFAKDLFIYPALNGHRIIPAETMASPFHGCTYYAYVDGVGNMV